MRPTWIENKRLWWKIDFYHWFQYNYPLILTLIKRTKYFNFLEIRQLITDFLRLLHEPRLPLNNMNDVMSSVGARLPSDLQRIIAKALKNYEQELYRNFWKLINFYLQALLLWDVIENTSPFSYSYIFKLLKQ